MKQNASFDASFWINVCAGNIVTFVEDYFYLFSTNVVAGEIRYPLDVLGIDSKSTSLFNNWVNQNRIIIQKPNRPVSWFQSGENEAIALAIEQNYFFLIDDANPYHHAKNAGLRVIGSSDFTVFLYDQNRIVFDKALEALKQIQISKNQRRIALTTLEMLRRQKEK